MSLNASPLQTHHQLKLLWRFVLNVSCSVNMVKSWEKMVAHSANVVSYWLAWLMLLSFRFLSSSLIRSRTSNLITHFESDAQLRIIYTPQNCIECQRGYDAVDGRRIFSVVFPIFKGKHLRIHPSDSEWLIFCLWKKTARYRYNECRVTSL